VGYLDALEAGVVGTRSCFGDRDHGGESLHSQESRLVGLSCDVAPLLLPTEP
jgi:hypothetical protein